MQDLKFLQKTGLVVPLFSTLEAFLSAGANSIIQIGFDGVIIPSQDIKLGVNPASQIILLEGCFLSITAQLVYRIEDEIHSHSRCNLMDDKRITQPQKNPLTYHQYQKSHFLPEAIKATVNIATRKSGSGKGSSCYR